MHVQIDSVPMIAVACDDALHVWKVTCKAVVCLCLLVFSLPLALFAQSNVEDHHC
jgi:hypothetical protein